MTTLQITLPDEACSALRRSPDELVDEMRLDELIVPTILAA
ncbi:MAG: hypothetical protein ACFCVA_09075 [Gammaproteobacteria bacterium]